MNKRQPSYLQALLRHLEETDVADGFHHVEVRHNSDCAMWDGGACDCDPDVESGIDRKYGSGRGQP